ncbi:phosphatidylglycerophosphate synthase [Planotetraspora sp. GP83]
MELSKRGVMGDLPPSPEIAGTVALVYATSPAAGLRCDAGSLLQRLTRQLVLLPVRDLHVVTRGDDGFPSVDGMRHTVMASDGLAEDLRIVAKVARSSTCPVAVLPGDVVAHTEALAALLEHPSRGTGAIVANGEAGPLRPPVRTEWGRVVSAGNSFHEVAWANGTFRGVLQVGEAHLASLADVADELADLAQSRHLGRAADTEVADLLLAGLVRAGVPVMATAIGRLHCERVVGRLAADAAIQRLAEVDEPEARLDAAIKTGDGFFSTYCVSSWSRHVVRLAARLRLTPNAVTGISVGLAVIAAIWFSDGSRVAQIIGAVALYLSFVLDCVDGQLARYTRAFSPLGGWLDAIADRVKEYVVYVGLALGYAAGPGGPRGIWALAVGAMILQTIRHMVGFSYAGAVADAVRSGAVRTGPPRSLAVPWDTPPDPRSMPGSQALQGAGSVLALSRRFDHGVAYWMKKIIVLPIGERMALIAVTAAVADARVTFLALLGWGGGALLYTVAGRIARSLA